MNKMKIFSLILTCGFMLLNCSPDESTLNSARLKSLVISALSGDQKANLALSGLIDKKHFGKNDYNQLKIDSSYMNHKYYYSVLLEYPEPTLNLLAIYDHTLRFYLLDKSLNGNITVEWAQQETRNFCFVQERFLTKDVLSIDRLSVYQVQDTNASLIYRALSRLVKDQDTVSQAVIKISEDRIVTKISAINNLSVDGKTDTFYFNALSNRYYSSTDLFKEFVKKEIKDFRWIPIRPQLADNILNDGIIMSGDGYQISAGEGWKKIQDFTLTRYLKANLAGDSFFNEQLGARFTVLEIPDDKKAEDFCRYTFGESTAGKYKMRSTELRKQGASFFQIFEHYCGKRKFLLVFECQQATYNQYKTLYNDTINSFFIECR